MSEAGRQAGSLSGDSKDSKKRENCDYKQAAQTKRRYVAAESNSKQNFDIKPNRSANCDLLSSEQEAMSSTNNKFVDMNLVKLEAERDNELSDFASDDDDDFGLNYEPILARILDEKKLALMQSPQVVSFLNDSQRALLNTNVEQ